jgi:hypothetical protein
MNQGKMTKEAMKWHLFVVCYPSIPNINIFLKTASKTVAASHFRSTGK